ncbi:hypothetical protein [Sporosarcina sp. FSL K6-1508]|uniref:hypothetical protein n=1 Tax=Sporosarcina sp. FSL K6-1508 TaxID=2921553 RepID=UPI0030F9509E
MKLAASVKELIEFSDGTFTEENPVIIYVSQGGRVPDETVLLDEDTASANKLQILTVLIHSEKESIYYEYPFNEVVEMEEINHQLEVLFERFSKEVIDAKTMARKVNGVKWAT